MVTQDADHWPRQRTPPVARQCLSHTSMVADWLCLLSLLFFSFISLFEDEMTASVYFQTVKKKLWKKEATGLERK